MIHCSFQCDCCRRTQSVDPVRAGEPGESGIRTILPPAGWIEVHTATQSLDACSPRCQSMLVAELKKGSGR